MDHIFILQDIIARRMRLAFLNAEAAEEALPQIIDIMGEELKWSKAEKKVCSVNLKLEYTILEPGLAIV